MPLNTADDWKKFQKRKIKSENKPQNADNFRLFDFPFELGNIPI